MGNDYRAGGGGGTVPSSYHVEDVFASISNDLTDRSRVDATYLHQTIYNTELPGVAYDIRNQNSDQMNIAWTWRDDVTGTDRVLTQFWWNQSTFNADATNSSKQQTFVKTLFGQPFPEMANGGNVQGNGLTESWGGAVVNSLDRSARLAVTHWCGLASSQSELSRARLSSDWSDGF